MKKLCIIIGIAVIVLVGAVFLLLSKYVNEDINNYYFKNMNKNTASYNTKIQYQINEPIEFPDFTVTFVQVKEDRPAGGGLYNILITKSIFIISDGEISQEISWSSGAGEVAPVGFEFNGKKYFLEKGFSMKYGILKNDELVIKEEEESNK